MEYWIKWQKWSEQSSIQYLWKVGTFLPLSPRGIGLTSVAGLIRVPYTPFPIMGNLHVSILHNMIRPLKFGNKDIVCGGDGGRAKQRVQSNFCDHLMPKPSRTIDLSLIFSQQPSKHPPNHPTFSFSSNFNTIQSTSKLYLDPNDPYIFSKLYIPGGIECLLLWNTVNTWSDYSWQVHHQVKTLLQD